MTGTKPKKNIEKSVVWAVFSCKTLSLLNALQTNKPTKCIRKLKARNWREHPGEAKPACKISLESRLPQSGSTPGLLQYATYNITQTKHSKGKKIQKRRYTLKVQIKKFKIIQLNTATLCILQTMFQIG